MRAPEWLVMNGARAGRAWSSGASQEYALLDAHKFANETHLFSNFAFSAPRPICAQTHLEPSSQKQTIDHDQDITINILLVLLTQMLPCVRFAFNHYFVMLTIAFKIE
jgi:hypothetical protein